MTSIQDALWYSLANSATISALVSDRIYPTGEVPSSVNIATEPYIAYSRVGDAHERHQEGGAGLANATYEIQCWASTELAAHNVYDAVRVALDNTRGNMGESGHLLEVRGIFLDSDMTIYLSPSDAMERGAHCVVMEFSIWYVE